MLPGMPKFPGEDFINSFYPILFALILGLIIGFRFVFRRSDISASVQGSSESGHCKTYRDTRPTGSLQVGLVIGFRVRDRVRTLGLSLGSG